MKNIPFISGLLCLLLLLSCSQDLMSQTFSVSGVSDLKRVFEDGYKVPPPTDTVRIFGIRGEVLSGQIAVNAKKDITGVSVEAGPLTNGGNKITSVEWNFTGSVPLKKNTPNQPPEALARTAPANYPDYLMQERQVDMKKGSWKGIWLTLRIPEDASAGIYNGSVTVKSNQETHQVPVKVQVYPLTIPRERHLAVTEWYSTRSFEKFHGIKEQYSDAWFAMLKKYAENMTDHRQNIFQVPAGTIAISKENDGALKFDFTRFDQIAEVFWSTGKMDYLETGELVSFGPKSWGDPEIIHRNFKIKDASGGEITIPGDEVLPQLLPAIESHLRSKGWLNKSFFHVKDEPSLHNALSWQKMSAYVHRLAPDLKRMDAIETPYLLNEIEVAVPKLDAFASWYPKYKEGKENGVELWFYTVGIYQGSLLPNKTIDMPVMDSRLLHWLNYRYGANGYLHWGWNQWDDDPYKEIGMHVGDGWHVYPIKDGVINSLRWEQMRNGIQDYEYFWMLENKICALRDSLGSVFDWICPAQRGVEIASTVVPGFAEHTDDPEVLYNAKKEVIRELLDFNVSPRIYIQCNPMENSALTSGSSIEIMGWTEPGTKIVVNGQELPVSNRGLFMEKIGLSRQRGTVRVQATSPAGSKEIIRNFIIK